jgi:hypothetical protein
MYKEHCPKIAAAMRSDLEAFKRGLYFVVCSIRQPVINVPEQIEDVARYGAGADCIFGHKRDAIPYIDAHAAALQRDVLAARALADALRVLLVVPGMGIVKSAFVLQLMGRNIARLDSRNNTREGLNPHAYATHGLPPHKLARKIERYVMATRGKARFYWDAWCADVARVYKRTPEEISALHLCIIKGIQYDLEDTF